jgi:hypothetical protein
LCRYIERMVFHGAFIGSRIIESQTPINSATE